MKKYKRQKVSPEPRAHQQNPAPYFKTAATLWFWKRRGSTFAHAERGTHARRL